MSDTIKKINSKDTYVATLRLYSRGEGEEVAMMYDFSHQIDDEFEGELPASYALLREIILGLHANTTMYAATKEDAEFLSDPNVSEEERAVRILEVSKAQEDALEATIN